MSKQEFYKPEFVQTSVLPIIFGLSENYFLAKKAKGAFREKVHYFYPTDKNPKSKSRKQAMLWSIDAVRNYITGNDVDEELQELLSR